MPPLDEHVAPRRAAADHPDRRVPGLGEPDVAGGQADVIAVEPGVVPGDLAVVHVIVVRRAQVDRADAVPAAEAVDPRDRHPPDAADRHVLREPVGPGDLGARIRPLAADQGVADPVGRQPRLHHVAHRRRQPRLPDPDQPVVRPGRLDQFQISRDGLVRRPALAAAEVAIRIVDRPAVPAPGRPGPSSRYRAWVASSRPKTWKLAKASAANAGAGSGCPVLPLPPTWQGQWSLRTNREPAKNFPPALTAIWTPSELLLPT